MRKRNRRIVAVAWIVAWAGLGSIAEAHDLWLVPEAESTPVGEEIVLLGQTGMKFPESLSALAPERIDRAWVVDASGRRPVGEGEVAGDSLRFTARFDAPGTALAAVAVKPRFIAIEADDFNDYLRHDGLPQILKLREKRGELDVGGREMYAKFAKAILVVGKGGPADLATRPAGLRIEIVPLVDPRGLGAGELPVQVLFEGEPLEGVHVYPLAEGEDEYAEGYRTDDAGKTAVPIATDGLWSLHCIHMRPYADKAEADWESFFATTTFRVGG